MNENLEGISKAGVGSDDGNDLASFGYRQELVRTLGSFSSFAAGFSYISILTGTFQTFYLGFGMGGPAFFWTWPFVLLGQLLVALCFAELAAHYPLSGGVYQWSKYVATPGVAWMTGWIYLACLVVTLAAVALALQNILPQIDSSFQIIGDASLQADAARNGVLLGGALILISVLVNSVGVRVLSAFNNVGVFCELLGAASLIVLLAAHALRSPGAAVLDTGGNPRSWGYLRPFLASAALTASYVMFGFDTAGSLAEETKNPRVRAPRAILQCLLAAGIAGLLLLLFSLMAAPDLKAPELTKSSGGLGLIVTSAVGTQLSKIFLWDVVLAIFACLLAVHSGLVRILFAMARDNQLPWSHWLKRVSPRAQIPVAPVIASGLLALGFLLMNVNSPKLVEMVTSVAVVWANAAYFLVVTGLLFRRLKRGPLPAGAVSGLRPFSLGRWGLPVNILAVLWSGFLFINAGWPRVEIYGADPFQRFSALWLTFSLVALGSAYYWFAQRGKGSPVPNLAS